MNGTSMSAPHVTGAIGEFSGMVLMNTDANLITFYLIGLLISGLKARNIPFSPFSIKRALEQTAMFLDGVEVFAQGHGLIQVNLLTFS